MDSKMVAYFQGGNKREEVIVGCRVAEPLMPKPLIAGCGRLCSKFYK